MMSIKSLRWRRTINRPLGALRATVLVCVLASGSVNAADQPASKSAAKPATNQAPLGFVDKDRDGVNDLYVDTNGDGINDRTGKPYPHPFTFEDKDGDGINDLYVDKDGDGVNDLNALSSDKNKDGLCNNLIDMDNDQRNDITGLPYDQRSLRGFRYGKVDEERRQLYERFLDRDGDGMHDPLRRLLDPLRLEQMDRFIDEDGDGIADDRRLHGRPGRSLPPHLRERLKQRPPRHKQRPPHRKPPKR